MKSLHFFNIFTEIKTVFFLAASFFLFARTRGENSFNFFKQTQPEVALVVCCQLDPGRHRHHQYARRRQELPTRQGRVSHRYSPPLCPGWTKTTEGRKTSAVPPRLNFPPWTLRWIDLDFPAVSRLLSLQPSCWAWKFLIAASASSPVVFLGFFYCAVWWIQADRWKRAARRRRRGLLLLSGCGRVNVTDEFELEKQR